MSTLASGAGGILDLEMHSSELTRLSLPNWLTELRQQGWQKFASLPMPTRNNEKWRFSDTRTLSFEGYSPARMPDPAQVHELIARSHLVSEAAGIIVHIDGHCVLQPKLAPELVSQGVIFESLEETIRSRPRLLQQYLLKHTSTLGGEKFAALHQAWLRAGYVLHIPKGVVIEQPFVSVTWTLTEGVALFPHSLILADENSQASIQDFQLSAQPEQRALAISASDIYAQQGAKLHRLSLQAWGSNTQSFQIDNTSGGRDSVINSIHASVGSQRARLESTVRIDGPGADVHLYGISVASGSQEFDQRTLQIHTAANAKSNLLFKNTLLGKARTIFSGLIQVARAAQRTDAFQTNRNLLLSPDAEADSLPGLEIEANDVKCSHGATTGQIDPAELFYLRSRGIPLATAQELLAQGFLEEVLSKLPHKESANTVREMLRQKFHNA